MVLLGGGCLVGIERACTLAMVWAFSQGILLGNSFVESSWGGWVKTIKTAGTKGEFISAFCPFCAVESFLVAQWYDLRLMMLVTRVQTLPWAWQARRMLTQQLGNLDAPRLGDATM